MTERRLGALADAVTDGERVDWRGVATRLTSSHSRALAAQLRTLAEIGHAGGAPAAVDPRSTRLHLPALLRLVSALAAIIAVTGVLGILSGAALDGPRLLRLWIVGAFSVTGLLLTWGASHRGAAALGGAYWAIAASFAVGGTGELLRTLPLGSMAPVLNALRPEAFLAAFFWQFVREFPAVARFSRVDRVCTVLYRASVILGVSLFVMNVAPALVDVPRASGFFQAFDRMRGWGDWFWGLVFAATLPALTMLPLRAGAATPDERRRVRAFLWGIAFGLGPVVTAVLAEAAIPAFARALDAPGVSAAVGWLVYPPIVAMPVITAYVVAVHGVLNVPVVLRRGLTYLLARWLVVWGMAATLLILPVYLYGRRSQSLAEVLALPRARVLLGFAALGIVLVVFRAAVTRALARWATPEADDPGAMLLHLSDDLKGCRTPIELATAFARAAERALQTTAAIYVMADHERLQPVGDAAPPPLPTSGATSLVPLLARTASGPCVTERGHAGSYYGLVSASDRSWIDDRRIGVIVPLRAGRGGDTPIAVVALESRMNAQPLSSEDLRFLAAASASVSFAADAVYGAARAPRPDEAHELARQCSGCGRVAAWRPDAAACECGGTWAWAALPKVIADRFALDALLGSGGMGVVYRATDTVLHRVVAIKTLPKLSAAAAERLMVEARAMAALSHPHIAVLYGTDTWRETPVLIMEYLAGGTLAARIRHARLDVRAALRVAAALAGALEYVHLTGWYHGDIKPSNIGFTEPGSPKFLDFGLSRAWADAGAPLAGTLPYLSPEVLRGKAAGPALDLWALCVVLFEAVAGVHPFLDGRQTESRIAAGLDGARAVSCPDPELRTFFQEALAADPARRPQTASALGQRLSVLDQPLG